MCDAEQLTNQTRRYRNTLSSPIRDLGNDENQFISTSSQFGSPSVSFQKCHSHQRSPQKSTLYALHSHDSAYVSSSPQLVGSPAKSVPFLDKVNSSHTKNDILSPPGLLSSLTSASSFCDSQNSAPVHNFPISASSSCSQIPGSPVCKAKKQLDSPMKSKWSPIKILSPLKRKEKHVKKHSSSSLQNITKAFTARFTGHKRKSTHLQKKLFGVPLNEVMEFQSCSGITANVPLIVQHCVHCLSSKLDEEGIFRKSGLHSDINNWKESLDNGVPIHTLINEQSDCHSITGLLKLYFRELPSPLIEESYHEEFFKIVKSDIGDEEKIDALKITIEKMGVYERDLFKYLCQLLRQVARRQEFNKMTVPNLARIWAPNLVWSRAISNSDSMKSIEFNHNSERLMKILIAESEYLTEALVVEPVTFFMLTEPFNPTAELEDSSELLVKPSPKRRCAKPAPTFSLTESPGFKSNPTRPQLPDSPIPPKFDEGASTTELNVYSNPSCTESLSATVPFTQTLQSPEKPDCSETECVYSQSKKGKILLREFRLSQPKVSVRKPLCATSSASQTEDLSTISATQPEDHTEPYQ